MTVMKVRRVTLASVSAAYLAAWVAVSGPAYALNATESQVLVRSAYLAFAAGRAEEATALYADAISSRTLSPEALAIALLNKALAEQKLKRHDVAVGDYTAAINIDALANTLRSIALYNRGLSQHALKKLPLAIEDYTSALLLNAELPQAFLSRGQALRESGQFLFALSDFERAIRFDHPNKALANFSIGLIYEQLGRPAEAKIAYTAALADNSQFKPAIDKLGALQFASTARPASPENAHGVVPSIGTGTIDIVKPTLAKAIEPPAELLQEARVTMATEPKPALAMPKAASLSTRKIYYDRIPADESDSTFVATAGHSENTGTDVSAEITGSTSVAPPVGPPRLNEVPGIPETEEVSVKSVSVATQSGSLTGDNPQSAGWAVQLVSASSEAGAWSSWKKMSAKSEKLQVLEPVVVRADLGTKGVFYRVRLVGYEKQADAHSMCKKLKNSGVKCYVSKTGV